MLAVSLPDDMNARSTSSMCIVDGNFGACPNPPHSASNEPTICLSAPLTASIAGTPPVGRISADVPIALTSAVAFCVDLVAPVVPDIVDGVHQLEEVGFGEVGAAVERPSVGGHEHGHRPPAPTGHRLHRVHVDRVDVGPLFTVDLDVDEVLVHRRCDLIVLEALVRHDMAPVARRVPDREQHRYVRAHARHRTRPAPRRTNRPGSRGAGGGTGTSRQRAGSSGPTLPT